MNNDSFPDWQAKYPNLFREYPRCGFYHPKGWDTLVHALCLILEAHIARTPEDQRSHYCCAQTKEKFGGLRFYMSSEDEFMSGAIAVAEDMSFHICQDCGGPGEARSGTWLRTLCDGCETKRSKAV